MNGRHNLRDLINPKLDPKLRAHLSTVDLTSLLRISPERLHRTALPNIGLIELVSGPNFKALYQTLYDSLFHGGERERASRIINRLAQDSSGNRANLAPYRLLGIRDTNSIAIAAAHFSILTLSPRDGHAGGSSDDGTGSQSRRETATPYAIPYLQYIYVRASHRRLDLSELLHALVLGVTVADAERMGLPATSQAVPFTLFETEPPEHSGAVSGERTRIHARGGGVAMMVRDPSDESGRGRSPTVSAHVQPGLEVGEPPVTLIWALRPNPGYGEAGIDAGLVRECGPGLLRAYYQSLRDEGFPEANIALGERMAAERVRGREFVAMPLAEVTGEMYRDLDGGSGKGKG